MNISAGEMSSLLLTSSKLNVTHRHGHKPHNSINQWAATAGQCNVTECHVTGLLRHCFGLEFVSHAHRPSWLLWAGYAQNDQPIRPKQRYLDRFLQLLLLTEPQRGPVSLFLHVLAVRSAHLAVIKH
ncbi:hypothetical protein BaRGS_00036358 [Batillaria attramentaria]|uniref:Uncharacterized protein n=1 Tax=Batillaria attramentaria TaxID=370345 RepID=A0ABD0JBT1_9CAEN